MSTISIWIIVLGIAIILGLIFILGKALRRGTSRRATRISEMTKRNASKPSVTDLQTMMNKNRGSDNDGRDADSSNDGNEDENI